MPSKQQQRHNIRALQLTSKPKKNPSSTIYVWSDTSKKVQNTSAGFPRNVYHDNIVMSAVGEDFLGRSDGKEFVYNAGDLGLILGSGRFPGEGNGNPLQYSCLENPRDGRAW